MIKLLFGKAGAGKSHIGDLAGSVYGWHFYDADQDLPRSFRRAIERQEKVSEEVREEYIQIVISKLGRLMQEHDRLCVSQALPRDKYRKKILNAIPSVEFVWVDAPDVLIRTRLMNRSGHVATTGYAQMVNLIFEQPAIPHVRIDNDDDPKKLEQQMKAVFVRTH